MDSFSSNDMEQTSQPALQQRHHLRRAHSDFSSSFRLPNFDDLLLFDPSDLELSSFPSPLPPPRGASVDSDHSSAAHFRSLSVDSDFFDGLGLSGDADNEAAGGHRHSNSFDSELSFDGLKKSITPEKLAELSLIDPKKVKRILANRQSAARSKERKVRYTSELERKVQTLQTEATTLSAQVTVLQRDTTAIITENKELKIRLQATEQQAKLRDALNEKLKEEVERLKFETNHMPLGNGNPFYRGIPPQYAAPQAAMHNQRVGIPSQNQQLHTLHNQSANGQSHPSFMEFNQRT